VNKRDKAIRRNAMNRLKEGLAKNIDKKKPRPKVITRVLTKVGFRSIMDQPGASAGSDRVAASRHTGFSDYRPTGSVINTRIETRKGKRKIVRKRKARFTENIDKNEPVTKSYWDMPKLQREIWDKNQAKDLYYLWRGTERGFAKEWSYAMSANNNNTRLALLQFSYYWEGSTKKRK
jgi:hypothetical protein